MAKSRAINFSPKEMNIRFIDLWKKLIPKALEGGYMCLEMDLGSIIREQLWKNFVDGSNYRCYQDIPLLYQKKGQYRAEYDLAILHYPNGTEGDNKRDHYPAIAAEFKLWKGWKTIAHDINKLEILLKQEKDCFVHSMSILDIYTDNSFKGLEDYIGNCKKKGWDVQLTILSSNLIVLETEFSQWRRYKGNPYKYNWYPLKKDGTVKNKQRRLVMLRLSKSN